MRTDLVRIERRQTRYAKGRAAWGQCQRCGQRYLRDKLAEEERTGLLVCRDCDDPIHPQETVVVAVDAIALEKPAPDQDDPGSGLNTSLEDDEKTTFPNPGYLTWP